MGKGKKKKFHKFVEDPAASTSASAPSTTSEPTEPPATSTGVQPSGKKGRKQKGQAASESPDAGAADESSSTQALPAASTSASAPSTTSEPTEPPATLTGVQPSGKKGRKEKGQAAAESPDAGAADEISSTQALPGTKSDDLGKSPPAAPTAGPSADPSASIESTLSSNKGRRGRERVAREPSSKSPLPSTVSLSESVSSLEPVQDRGRGRGRGRGEVKDARTQLPPGMGDQTRPSSTHSRKGPSPPGAPQPILPAAGEVVPQSRPEIAPAWRRQSAQTAGAPQLAPTSPVPRTAPQGSVPMPVATRGPSPPQQVVSGRPAQRGDVGDASVRSITKGISTLKIPARKPGGAGTKGIPIIVETNHFALDLSKLRKKTAIHYDVAMNPEVPKRLLRQAMEAMRQKHFRDRFPAYDGRKNLVSADMLPFGQVISDTVNVRDEESTRDKEFEVTIKFAARVDLSVLQNYMASGTSLDAPQTALQMLDIVLRCAPALKCVQVGRSFFTPPTGQVVDLGEGVEMWLGVFQSVSLGWKPFVNVDVAHKGFPKAQNVVDLMYELFPRFDHKRGLDAYEKKDFEKYIKGLKIEYEIPNQPNTKRTYRVNGAVNIPSKMMFSLDSGEKINVEDYYKREKRYQIQCPGIVCLHVGSLNRTNPIYLPAELCRVTAGQVTMRKMTELQTSNMIKEAATSTDVRKRKIMDAFSKVGFNGNRCVQDFGLSVSDRFERVSARVLKPPSLSYLDKTRPVTPSQGVWKVSTFLEGRNLSRWTVLVLDKYVKEDVISKFATQLVQVGKTVGMNISNPTPLMTPLRAPASKFQRPDEFNRICQDLKQYLLSCKGMDLVFVVVPDKGEAYAKVKQLAELTVGVLTQCIKCRTMNRINFSTVSNILLKVNSKLNGINHTITQAVRPKCLNVPSMLVGADVTHPSPDMERIPSVAAVCASHDPKGFQYNIQYRLQPAREEIIRDLQDIMRQHLWFFKNKTGYSPQHILFYRDGVSEGQFSQVLNAELMAIRRACQSLNVNYKPMITFLVVQKRHHTRFFPTRREDADGRNMNVPPGTIVDTTITHPTELDFYLVSHASIQGVSRPTKYRRLWDDSNMSEDDLEELTYFLCHMFSRCTRSVSYPAPTYYAHLAAYRARVYIEGKEIGDHELDYNQELAKAKEDFVKSSPMFFV